MEKIRLIGDLKAGDKIYFYCFDSIREYEVIKTESSIEPNGNFSKTISISGRENGSLHLGPGELNSDVVPMVCMGTKYFGMYGTSKNAIGRYLEDRYRNEIATKEREMKNADYRIERAKEQLENFKQITEYHE